jgi:peptide/nickel transport system ATP-binding protein
MDNSMESLLRISDLEVQYDTKDYVISALDGVSVEIPRAGYTLGLVGESGSGKTTLGSSILNLLEPPAKLVRGEIDYAGKNVLKMSKRELRQYRWQEVSMIYQSAMNSLNPVNRVLDPIIEVLRIHQSLPKPDARDRATKLLSEVGIKTEHMDSYPHQLSGGMRQRVVIALALALSPKLLIADEPTSALDAVVQKQILTLLKREVTERNLSMVFITHEISILNDLVESVAVMFRGEIVEIGPHDSVVNKPLHPYTEMLLMSLITLESTFKQLSASVPSGGKQPGSLAAPSDHLADPSSNFCKYSKRCKYVFERCRVERPRLMEVESGRWVACHKYG